MDRLDEIYDAYMLKLLIQLESEHALAPMLKLFKIHAPIEPAIDLIDPT